MVGAVISGAIAALIGAVVSALFNYFTMRRENLRQEAARLFCKIAEDLHAYEVKWMEFYHAAILTQNSTPPLVAQQRGETYYQALQKSPGHVREHDAHRERVEKLRATRFAIRSQRSLLEADKLALRLLFKDKSRVCETCIDEVIKDSMLNPSSSEAEFRESLEHVRQYASMAVQNMEVLFRIVNEGAEVVSSVPNAGK